jgi:hypothetical protein
MYWLPWSCRTERPRATPLREAAEVAAHPLAERLQRLEAGGAVRCVDADALSRAVVDDDENPVERVWLYLRERFLSLRVFAGYRAILRACCETWNRLVAESGRLRSLCDQPWIRNVSS